MYDYLNKEGLIRLWEKIKNKLSLKQDVITDLDEIRDGASKGATALQEHQDISGKVDKKDGYDLVKETDIAQITTNKNAINILNGDGEGSVTKAVADEIAKVVADAPEDFNTLKELSDWISDHQDDASAMNSAIQENAADIASIEQELATKITSADIPKNVSAFTNDAGYLTEHQDISGKANKADVYNKGEADGRYLKLTGGTMTGDITLSEGKPIITVGDAIVNTSTNGSTNIMGGTGYNDGATLVLRGNSQGDNGGNFELWAGSSQKSLTGTSAGVLTWCGELLLTSANIPKNVSAFTNDAKYITSANISPDYTGQVYGTLNTGASIQVPKDAIAYLMCNTSATNSSSWFLGPTRGSQAYLVAHNWKNQNSYDTHIMCAVLIPANMYLTYIGFGSAEYRIIYMKYTS